MKQVIDFTGAGNEARTRDLNLGKITCQPTQTIEPIGFSHSIGKNEKARFMCLQSDSTGEL
jgi:hypothetical protein